MNLNQSQVHFLRHVALAGARGIRASGSECAPILLLFNSRPDGNIGAMSAVNLAGLDKDQWVSLQQKHARSPDIAAALLVNEAWACSLDPGERIPDSVAARRDKREILILSLLTATQQWILQAEITGAKIADADFVLVDSESFQGRFIRAA